MRTHFSLHDRAKAMCCDRLATSVLLASVAAIGAPGNEHHLKRHDIDGVAACRAGIIEPSANFSVYHGRLPPFSLSFLLNLAGRKSRQVAASPTKL